MKGEAGDTGVPTLPRSNVTIGPSELRNPTDGRDPEIIVAPGTLEG
jgi:hypothetical protein